MMAMVIGGVLWYHYVDGVPHHGFMMLAAEQQILIHKYFGTGLDNFYPSYPSSSNRSFPSAAAVANSSQRLLYLLSA